MSVPASAYDLRLTAEVNGVPVRACADCYDRWDGTSDCKACGGAGYIPIDAAIRSA